MSGRFEDEASPSRKSGRQPSHRLDAAVDERQLLGVARSHAPHDLGVDLLGRLGEPDHVVHVPRPLRRAHPHHVGLRPLVPASAALAGELLAHLVPDVLGVDEHAVEVEDHRLDGDGHALRYSPRTRTSGGTSSPELDPPHLAHEERVRADGDLVLDRALEPAERADEQRRSDRSLDGADPVPHRDRRDAACEVLGEPLLTRGEERDARSRPPPAGARAGIARARSRSPRAEGRATATRVSPPSCRASGLRRPR